MPQNTLEAGELMPSGEDGLVVEISRYLNELENRKIYYPLEYGKILSLYGLRKTKEGKKLINERRKVLNQIIAAIELEKEGGIWESSEANREILETLRDLIKEK